jgi:hypothetical protein
MLLLDGLHNEIHANTPSFPSYIATENTPLLVACLRHRYGKPWTFTQVWLATYLKVYIKLPPQTPPLYLDKPTTRSALVHYPGQAQALNINITATT